MAMNVKASHEDDDEGSVMSEINVTPLVDVMLVLLIIFIVTAPLVLSTVPVKLPKAGLDEMGKPVDPIILSMDLQGNFYLEELGKTTEFPEDQLPARLADMYTHYQQFAGKDRFPVVYVRADGASEYGKVYAVIKKLSAANFYRVSLVSEAPQ